MYYDKDFYNEPSEYDIMVDEFKQSLLKSVKKEFLEEMEKLRKENGELQEIKRDWHKLKMEYSQKEFTLRQQIEKEKRRVFHMRLNELFEKTEMNTILYFPTVEYIQKEKCDKCNNERQIEFLSPSGRKMTEFCECANSYCIYYPQERKMVEFCGYPSINRPLSIFFEDKSDYSCSFDKYIMVAGNIYNGENFEDLYSLYNSKVFFKDINKCLEYCLYINNKKKNPKELIEKYCVIDEEN